jgi:DNA-binding SARP family transcriptional activator
MTMLDLHLFGPFAACVQGAGIPPLRTRKDAWLLALLAMYAPRPLDRSWLAGRLWSAEAAAIAPRR